ncbi:MAG: hypothetical protein HOW73_23340 [Polyangiaceae bacterium]|nr:hypothetical protein [Polyangiaceae bacterium]
MLRLRRFAPALLAGLATASLASSAQAIQPNEELGSRPTIEHHGGGDANVRGKLLWDRVPSRRASAYATFLAEVGPGWRASFDDRTGVPSRLYGPGLNVPGSVASGAIAESYAREFLARHLRLLAPGNNASDFELVSNDLDAGMRTLGFVQKSGSLRVLGGQVSFRFKNDRLFMIGSEALPSVPVLSQPSSIDIDRAKKEAMRWVGEDFGLNTAGAAGDAVVLPHRDASGALTYTVAIPFEVTPSLVTAKFRVYVDATTYEPIVREQLFKFASANVALRVPERAPTYGQRFDAAALLTAVTVGGVTQKTDEAGAITWSGTDPTAIELSLNGDRARVWNDAGDEALLSVSLADATPYVWDQSSDGLVDAQLTSFVHAGRVREYARTFAPTLSFLNQQVKATVNIDDICNAFSDGTSINFYLEGNGCANTGRIADVVYHEYGHSIHAHAVIEGVGEFEGALSEGQADYLAATITGDPATARGFFMTEEELRHIDPPQENVWPDDVVGEVHYDGLIIGQALWDLRKNLIASLGEVEGVQRANELYYQGIRRAVDIPSMYPEILAADDDDGDISNGTPNVCEINEAFARHGLRPTTGTATSLGVMAPSQDGYEVSVELVGLFPQCEGEAIVGGTLSWRDRDLPASTGDVALDLSGNILTGTIPAQPDRHVIKYAVDVELEGPTVHFPDNAADPEYEFFIGEVTPLYCTDFEADPLAEGWKHGLEEGTPDEGADDWTWGEPNGNSQNGDPPAAFSGDNVFGNDLALEDNYNGLYQPEKTTFARSPVIELKGHKNVHLQYRRWLNVEDAHFDRATIHVGDNVVWQNLDSNQGDSSNTHHRDREWRFQDVDLSDAIGADDSVQVTFKIASDPGLEFGGWTIDDFCVVALDDAEPCVGDACGEGGAGGAGGGGAVGGEGGGDSVNPEPDDGCGCAVPGRESNMRGLGALAVAGLAALLRRRRAGAKPR